MRIVAFAGPSLSTADRRAFGSIAWMPPAEAGDLLRLDIDEPTVLCLIDGYFDHRPAVRHKEILLLLSEGVRIFGASSIGALRAAEMDDFGLTGVGAIYRAYVRGTIVGDDEVALIHASSDWDWRPLSLPLVDVRATLCSARRRGVLRGRDARALLTAATEIHYVDRSWATIAAAASLPVLEPMLKRCAVEQKRLDALECLRVAVGNRDALAKRPALVKTVFLDALAKECGVDLDARASVRVIGDDVTAKAIRVIRSP